MLTHNSHKLALLGPLLGNFLLIFTFVSIFLLWPLVKVVTVLESGELRHSAISTNHFQWHHSLSRDFQAWAVQRVASQKASTLVIDDISGTEWPMFSSVFYLWATESLQQAVEKDPALYPQQPKEYAAGALRAAVDLIADPNHASWVKQHWGESYLQRENLFYRMLLISGLTSYQRLSGDDVYEPLLRQQVTSLAEELDASPFGLLDDYPGQCYPIDILPAIAAIHRADSVLGTNHSLMIQRAIRGFEGTRLDGDTGLPAYIADSRTGEGIGPARGVGVAFMLIWAAEIWPQRASDWYALFERHFWQPGSMLEGFREFPRHVLHADLLFDIDAGPVISGIGTTASAFGIGAARTFGRFDHAYALSSQAWAAMLPGVDQRMMLPHALSRLTDAPYTGETILLFSLTRQPLENVAVVPAGDTPKLVYGILVAQGLLAMLILVMAFFGMRRALARRYGLSDRAVGVLCVIWWLLVVVGLGGSVLGHPISALILFVALFFPWRRGMVSISRSPKDP